MLAQLKGLASQVGCSSQQVRSFFIRLKAELRDGSLAVISRKADATVAELTRVAKGASSGSSPAGRPAAREAAAAAGDQRDTQAVGRQLRGPGASGQYHSRSPVGNKLLRRLPLSSAAAAATNPAAPAILTGIAPLGSGTGGGLSAVGAIAGCGDAAAAAAAAAAATAAVAAAAKGGCQDTVSVLCTAAQAAAATEQEKLQAVLEANGCTIKK